MFLNVDPQHLHGLSIPYLDGTSIQGVHLVAEVNMINPNNRIQSGDEIVQVKHQTVVGLQTKKVLQQMVENSGEAILTL